MIKGYMKVKLAKTLSKTEQFSSFAKYYRVQSQNSIFVEQLGVVQKKVKNSWVGAHRFALCIMFIVL